MDRTWLKIEGFDNYSVSNDGQVRNDLNNHIKEQRLNRYGYPIVSIYQDGHAYTWPVHRLVAKAFIDNPENKEQVNHKDGNKTNNNVDNLEWATRSENMKHAFATGLVTPHATRGMLGKKNPNAGRHGYSIKVIETGEVFKNIAACAKALDLSAQRICDVLKGYSRSYRGYTFEYV